MQTAINREKQGLPGVVKETNIKNYYEKKNSFKRNKTVRCQDKKRLQGAILVRLLYERLFF